jgi:hypothetical protein
MPIACENLKTIAGSVSNFDLHDGFSVGRAERYLHTERRVKKVPEFLPRK